MELQLELFPNKIDVSQEIKDRIQYFQSLINKSGQNYELAAVNKMYESVVVYLPESGSFHTAIERQGFISREYVANGRDGFGTNLLILDERFKDYESYTLEKGSQLVGCNFKDLGEYFASGWKVNRQGGVMTGLTQKAKE